MKYDVIVIGGRVAGSTSSLFASKSDVDVLMIEKRQEIGTPVQCAEATSYGTLKTLEMEPSKKYICTEIFGAVINSPDGHKVRVNGERIQGYILERKMFDKALAIESAKFGTDIMVKTLVKDLIIKNGEVKGVVAKHLGETIEIKADMVIAADGVESSIARIAGLNTLNSPKDVFSCAQYEMVGVDVHPNYMELYFGSEIAPGGYLWIFPKGNGVANVGLGIRSSKETAYHYLKKFVSNLDATPVELNVGGVPISGPIDKTYTDGLIVVGDAAGQVDPITGAGIHTSAACGRIAGEVAAEAIKTEDTSSRFLKKYQDLWKAEIGENLKISLKYRKAIDKLSDKDLNVLIEFFQGKDIFSMESIPKISLFKLAKKQPNLLKNLKDVL
ncbi:MAG: NAD(P)/FAD-dependent oxidoreductase [Euryarchaeota archaeon]|nr:NAD(P)/FAD-dependent oxidoreductase [Euryarchaeota archaeon]